MSNTTIVTVPNTTSLHDGVPCTMHVILGTLSHWRYSNTSQCHTAVRYHFTLITSAILLSHNYF